MMSDHSMDNDWEKPYEEDGVTLGPEDALRREIAKSKALKVEKLRLKDALEKLQAENDVLAKTNQSLEQKLNAMGDQSDARNNSGKPQDYSTLQASNASTRGWSIFLLLFNLVAVGILLIFLLKQ